MCRLSAGQHKLTFKTLRYDHSSFFVSDSALLGAAVRCLNNTMVNKVLPPHTRPNDRLEHALLSVWMEATDEGLCVVDDTSRVVMINPAACRLLDVDGIEVLNAPLKRSMEKLDIDGGASLLQWLGTPGFDGERHVTRRSANGLLQLLLKTVTLRASEGGLFKMVAITDVTALLTAQNRIDSANNRRQWEALNAGVVISDALAPDMPIVYVNTKFEEMSGYLATEVLGRNCRFLQGPHSDQSGLANIRDAIKNKTNGYALLRNYRKDGSIFMNELFVSPIKDAAGTVTHFMGIQHLKTDYTVRPAP